MRFVPGLAALPAERIFGLGTMLGLGGIARLWRATLAGWLRQWITRPAHGCLGPAPRAANGGVVRLQAQAEAERACRDVWPRAVR
jgi:hypothetical protein